MTWSERIFFSQIRHRNAFTEIAWEDAEQGLGVAMFTLASEKNRKLFYQQRVLVLQTVISLGVVSLVFRRHDLLKIAILIPSKKPDFRYGKNQFPERVAEIEPRSRSQLKSAWPNVATESK